MLDVLLIEDIHISKSKILRGRGGGAIYLTRKGSISAPNIRFLMEETDTKLFLFNSPAIIEFYNMVHIR